MNNNSTMFEAVLVKEEPLEEGHEDVEIHVDPAEILPPSGSDAESDDDKSRVLAEAEHFMTVKLEQISDEEGLGRSIKTEIEFKHIVEPKSSRKCPQKKKYPCAECHKVYKSKTCHTRHLRTHFPEAERSFKCKDCRKTFFYQYQLIAHERVHVGGKPFECPECDKTFAKKTYLACHKQVHDRVRGIECPDCDKSTGFKGSCERHQKLLRVKKEPRFICALCGKKYTDKAYLKRHFRIHYGLKPHKCEVCEKEFTQVSHLIIHRRIHTGVKPYKCTECESSFAYKNVLLNHIKLHNGIKPFKCEDCGKGFVQKYHLMNHKRIHTGEKPYKCPICLRAFNRSADVTKHQSSHTGEKNFKCQFCDSAYSRRPALDKHLAKHASMKPFKCFKCEKCYTTKEDLVRHRQMHVIKPNPPVLGL